MLYSGSIKTRKHSDESQIIVHYFIIIWNCSYDFVPIM